MMSRLIRYKFVVCLALAFGALSFAAPEAQARRGLSKPPSISKLLRSKSSRLQVEWATRYEHGEGVAKNLYFAIKLYCRAGWRGSADAQYRLGWIYANGRGGARNDKLAAQWFRLAASSGDKYARRMLRQVGGSMLRPAKRRPKCELPDRMPYSGSIRSVANPSRTEIASWVQQLAPHYGLKPELVLAVIRTESNFNARAISPKNAQGLMQLIPATAKRFGVKNVWDPVQNLKGGMAYLEWLMKYFKGEVELVLAGYNAGENAVDRYNGIPPYAETKGYVKRVKYLMRKPLSAILDRGA